MYISTLKILKEKEKSVEAARLIINGHDHKESADKEKQTELITFWKCEL